MARSAQALALGSLDGGPPLTAADLAERHAATVVAARVEQAARLLRRHGGPREVPAQLLDVSRQPRPITHQALVHLPTHQADIRPEPR